MCCSFDVLSGKLLTEKLKGGEMLEIHHVTVLKEKGRN